jgi:hypothetical protein
MNRSGRLAPLLFGAVGLVFVAGLVILLRAPGPGPDSESLSAPFEGLPPSTITFRIHYHASELLDLLEAEVPGQVGDIRIVRSHPSDPALRYAVQADRIPFEIELRDGVAHVSTVLTYGGQVWYATPFGVELSASCGTAPQTPPRAMVRFAVPIELQEDWTFSGGTRLESVEAVSENDRCEASILGLQLDVTEAILAEASQWLGGLADQIDDAFSELQLSELARPWWDAARDPVAVDEGVWFVLNPEGVHVGEPQGSGTLRAGEGGVLETQVTILAHPRVHLGPLPETTPAELPPLLFGDRDEAPPGNPWSHPAGEAIHLEGLLGYRELSTIVSDAAGTVAVALAGRPLEIPGIILGANPPGRLTAEVGLAGLLRGTVHLSGTPVLDHASNEVTFPDLDVVPGEGGLFFRTVVRITRWGILARLRRELRIPVGDAILQARSLAEDGLNATFTDDVRVSGTMGSLEITHLRAEADGLVIHARMQASTLLTIGAD